MNSEDRKNPETEERPYVRDLHDFWYDHVGAGAANVFHSARLKLTLFYFAFLLGFCLVLTIGVRAFMNYELHRSDVARSGAVHRLVERFYDPGVESPPSGQYFANTERQQSDVTRDNLNRDFLLVDISLLALGAVLSYWFAGRTLRPIEEAHEAQKRFTADASHELRTPLTNLRVENEVFLRQKHFTEPEARELIASNLEEVGRLQRLAANLLALNQYEGATLSRRACAVSEIVQDAVQRAAQTPGASHEQFSQKIPHATVAVDRESLTELLVIILDNALKYGPAGGKIELAGALSGQQYALSIRDHGPGIPEADLPRIFERMYRGDKARSGKVSGHGIGLSVAQQIAHANHLQLRAGNHPDGGAVFSVLLDRQ